MVDATPTDANDPQEWWRRARSSAQLARCRMDGVDPADLCFQAQQAAEKAIKAVLRMMDTVLAWADQTLRRRDEVRERTPLAYGDATWREGSREPDAELLRSIVACVVRAAAPDRVILFGSAARGEMHHHSDIDLLIVKGGDQDPIDVAAAVYSELDCDLPVDVVVTSPEALEQFGRTPGLVYHAALAEGKVIYEAGGRPGG